MEKQIKTRNYKQIKQDSLQTNTKIGELRKLMQGYFQHQNKKTMDRILPQIQKTKSEIRSKSIELQEILSQSNKENNKIKYDNLEEREKKIVEVKKIEKFISDKKIYLREIRGKREEIQKQIGKYQKILANLALQPAHEDDKRVSGNIATTSLKDRNYSLHIKQGSVNNKKSPARSILLKRQQNQSKKQLENKESPTLKSKHPIKQLFYDLRKLETERSQYLSTHELSHLFTLLFDSSESFKAKQMFKDYSINTYFQGKLRNEQILEQLGKISMI